MAATRRNAMLIEEARTKIRTTQLINRLQDHAFGKVEMTLSQVKCVEILLRKSVPDLASIELKGDPDNPISYVIKAPDQLPDASDWQSRYTSHPHGPN